MRSVYWSQPSADARDTSTGSGRESVLPPATPPEAPGVLVVHPLERWSLVDLVVGLGRLIRGAGTAAVRA